MQADIFYQTDAEIIYPLVFITKAMYEEQFAKLSIFEQQCWQLNRFTGNVGEVCIVQNSAGCVQTIYIGTDDGKNQTISLAAAISRLPAGNYQVADGLTHQDMVIWSLEQYRFDAYKTFNEPLRVLIVPQDQLTHILLESTAVFHARDLINQPANYLNPQALSDILQNLAKKHHGEFNALVGDDLIIENYPAIHAVGRAASVAPRLLSLQWGNKNHPRVTLVGKGVCFDSGGLDIKSSPMMRYMKKDMGGAAMVIALAEWIMSANLPIRLHVLVPAVENAIGSQAYRPGDILIMRNKMSIEITNTDAEGRLILADALVKSGEEDPELLIDFATLTGAARVAVGTEISALFTNDDQLAAALSTAAQEMYDPVWRMPLFAGYNDLNQSSVADIANASSSPYAGAISAALFLQKFIKPGLSWAHFDIMAWNVNRKPGRPEGGEAMGIRTVARYLFDRYKQS